MLTLGSDQLLNFPKVTELATVESADSSTSYKLKGYSGLLPYLTTQVIVVPYGSHGPCMSG